jgi:aspartate/methionine/tyrosine aminotransferase
MQPGSVDSQLSRRAAALNAAPPMPEYLREHFSRARNAWHATDNPDGYLGLCVAENRLVWDLLEPRVNGFRDVPSSALGYDAMIGSERFRASLARFLSTHLMGRPVTADQLAVLAGAGSVLETLFWVLCDPGDGVLVPTPSYAGFWLDLELRDELTILPVHGRAENGFRLTPETLEASLRAADRPVKALLWTNPDNPRGAVASPAEIRAILDWAADHDLHVVADELYGCSVFGDATFVSAASLQHRLGSRLHTVWAFSKDFAASGLRCGVLHSDDSAVLRAVDGLSYWACCSGDTQHLLGTLLDDETWLDRYLAEMPRRLGAAYDAVTTALRDSDIPFLPSQAGFFLLLDMRQWLPSPDWEGERRLWRRILNAANVNVTPGEACRIAEPGFMRLCFAGLPVDGAVAAIARLGNVLGAFRR